MIPSNQLPRDLSLETIHRHHARERSVQQAMSQAGYAAELTKRVGCYPFRHSAATYLLQQSDDIRTV